MLDFNFIMSLQSFLSKKGINPSKYGDYQDYIEEKEKTLPITLYRQDMIPVRGSIHLALGRIISSKKINDKWNKIR